MAANITTITTRVANLERLAQPIGGLMSHPIQLATRPGDPRFAIVTAPMGDISRSVASVAQAVGAQSPGIGTFDGCGNSLDYEEARLKALAEGLERYSSCVYDEKQFLWATAEELGEAALDLDSLPRCSENEYAHPLCPIVAPDKQAPIRWVRAVSLLDGKLKWVPAVMVYLYIPPKSPGERIWMPISTGCAAHITLEKALVGAICEVVERDAISLIWLEQLELPRIEMDIVPARLQAFLERNQRASGAVRQLFFDATTDLGIPTVYSVQLSPDNQKLAALVMCSTELNPAVAIAKVVSESASSRLALHRDWQPPAQWDKFSTVTDGAVYMGHPDRLSAFDFLVKSTNRRRLSEMAVLDTGDPQRNLTNVIERFRERQMDIFAVDITSDEALRAGMRVVRTIIPALQPLSFSYRARYLGHPRLYDGPLRMGYQVRNEAEVNYWPQPFA